MFMKRRQSNDRMIGLSVIELLVSITVVSIMMAILFLTTGGIREAAQSTKCLSNLRQIGIALNGYAFDNGQFYPSTFSSTRNPPNTKTWMTAAGPYAGYDRQAMGGGDLPRATGIFYCPSMTEADRSERKVGYFYNAHIVAAKIKKQPLPMKTFLVVEGPPSNTEAITTENFISKPHQRHPNGISNFLSVDGSVEAIQPPFDKNDPRWLPTLN